MTQKYLVQTFGCQMNEHDSERMAGMLEKMDYEKTDNLEDANLILFNTCCVRESAEKKILGRLGELKALKSKNPDLIIGLCGCMAQKKETAEIIRRSYPQVDLLFGTHNSHQLPEMVRRIRADRYPLVDIWEREGEIVEDLPVKREKGLKAWVAITYGCNNYCTYCIVPYVRGRERSRKPEDILREIDILGREGFKEITLLGQNVNSYGKDFAKPYDFADLLQAIDAVPGIERIRYMTSHPRDFTDKLIDVIAASKHVCEHFHLPVQAGSNALLKSMNRGYTRESYLELVDTIRRAVPEAAITTDIIVGFPGETEDAFKDTLSLVEKVRYDAAFTFIYNKRSGTPAADMPNQVPEDVKRERIARLVEVQNKISLEKNREDVDKIKDVLVEGPNPKNPDQMTGRTRTNKPVHFAGNEDLTGKIVPVLITGAKTWNLEGELRER